MLVIVLALVFVLVVLAVVIFVAVVVGIHSEPRDQGWLGPVTRPPE